jgi:Domain of unknown function (DUF4184)
VHTNTEGETSQIDEPPTNEPVTAIAKSHSEATTPFTPFHFGPGLLIKAAAPRHFGLLAFAATQIVIDVETLVHLIRQERPLHRELHSVVGATVTGAVTSLVTFGIFHASRKLLARFKRGDSDRPDFASRRPTFTATMLGGLIGGASHTLLDSIMHQDVQPLWPFAPGNGMYGALSVPALHLFCLLAALLGIALLLVNRQLQANERE